MVPFVMVVFITAAEGRPPPSAADGPGLTSSLTHPTSLNLPTPPLPVTLCCGLAEDTLGRVLAPMVWLPTAVRETNSRADSDHSSPDLQDAFLLSWRLSLTALRAHSGPLRTL